jgi:hypothetical protein
VRRIVERSPTHSASRFDIKAGIKDGLCGFDIPSETAQVKYGPAAGDKRSVTELQDMTDGHDTQVQFEGIVRGPRYNILIFCLVACFVILLVKPRPPGLPARVSIVHECVDAFKSARIAIQPRRKKWSVARPEGCLGIGGPACMMRAKERIAILKIQDSRICSRDMIS